MGRARKGWDKEIADAAEAEGKSAEQKLRDDAAADKAAADERDAKANAKIVRAEAIPAAIEAGAKADRAKALIGLADLSDVEVDDNGDVDAAALKLAITNALAEYPEFKAGASATGASGAEHDGGDAGVVSPEQFKVMGYKERTELYNKDPEAYARLSAA